MRALVVRQKLVLAAAATVGAALLAACGPQQPSPGEADPTGDPSATQSAPAQYPSATVLISNGTRTVKVGDGQVTFPTTVTDAAFSHDGSRIAFVDADGNIATAHPDGTGVIVLTRKQAGVTRSSPTWYLGEIVYTRRAKDGTATLYRVWANGGSDHNSYNDGETEWQFGDLPARGNTAPSASAGLGDGVELAFQHTGAAAEVWVVDTNQRTPWAQKIANGAAAEVSPDGTKVAFVAPNGQVSVVAAKDEKAKPVQVTFGVASPSHLAWSGDGSRIAFETANGVASVAANPQSATSNPVTQHSTTAGVPTFVPSPIDTLVRLAAGDQVELAVTASQMRFPTAKQYSQGEGSRTASGAYLTGSTGVGATVAATSAFMSTGYPGPLLFTKSGAGLDPRTKAELNRIFGKLYPDAHPEVTIIGGTDVVSAQAENDLKALGYGTTRVAPVDLSTLGLPPSMEWAETLYVVDLDDSAGLAAAASYVGGFSNEMMFSQGGVFPTRTKALLNTVTKKATIIPLDAAGERAAKASWSGKPSTLTVAPVVGTNAQRLRTFGAGVNGVILVDRGSAKDMLVATSLGRSLYYAVIAVDPKAPLDPAVLSWLDATSGSLNRFVLVDSAGKFGNDVISSAMKAVSGPLGFAEAPPDKA